MGAPGTTRLGFGCAGLMREPSRRRRQRLLASAFDSGVRHFDVARMYGLGAAEGELGSFAKGRREQLTIATKFGIEASAAPGRLAALQGPARRLLARYPGVRRYVKRRSQALHRHVRYDAAAARASLERSLRELGTDYVDVLFLHGPEPGDAVDVDGLGEYLLEARQAGWLRAWGVAGEHRLCAQLRSALPSTAVLQTQDDVLERRGQELVGLGEPLITFGVLSGALQPIVAHLAVEARRRAWSERLGGIDLSSSDTLASLLLAEALDANRLGTVLFSTTRPERVRRLLADVGGELADEDLLSGLRALVAEDAVGIRGPQASSGTRLDATA